MHCLRQATAEDAAQAVALIISSAPEALPRLFNQQSAQHTYLAQTFLTQAFQCHKGQFGFGNHWVVEIQGQLAAIGCVWQRNMGDEYVQATLESMTHYYQGSDVLEVLHRCQSLQQVFARPGENDACVGHIGVAEAFQRQGLCTELLSHFETLAQNLGKQYLTLDVKRDNTSAVSCYQKAGFTIERTMLDTSPMKLGTYLHMRKTL